MSGKRAIRESLKVKVRELLQEMGSAKAVAKHLKVREAWVYDCYSGFATPLAELAVYASVGLRYPETEYAEKVRGKVRHLRLVRN